MAPSEGPITIATSLPAGRIDGRVPGIGRMWRYTRVILAGRSGERWLRLDHEGRFSARVPPDAEVSLQVVTPEGASALAERVRASAYVELLLRPPGVLRGMVHGAPRAFHVVLNGPGHGWPEVFFATDGSFEMRGVPALSTFVQAFADGLAAEERVTLSPGETRWLDLKLVPPEGLDVVEQAGE
jgi:hypothetical protein